MPNHTLTQIQYNRIVRFWKYINKYTELYSIVMQHMFHMESTNILPPSRLLQLKERKERYSGLMQYYFDEYLLYLTHIGIPWDDITDKSIYRLIHDGNSNNGMWYINKYMRKVQFESLAQRKVHTKKGRLDYVNDFDNWLHKRN